MEPSVVVAFASFQGWGGHGCIDLGPYHPPAGVGASD